MRIPFLRRREDTRETPQTPAEQRVFSLADLERYTGSLRSSAYTSEGEMRGIPALTRAARLRAEAIARLKLRCWSGEGDQRQRRDTVWQAKLFAGRANKMQTRFAFWDTLGESLAYRNNAWIWPMVDPLTGRFSDWWALHPDQVQLKGSSWEVTVGDGYLDPVGRGRGKYVLTYEQLIHIRGHGDGGTPLAPSPIELFRQALAGPVGRQKHEGRMWRKGTTLQAGIKFPPGVTTEQADEWRAMWQASYEGTDGDTTPVIGGGSEFVKIGMTASDAQFVQMADLTVLDAALIMGVPVTLLRPTADVSPDVEQELAAWLSFGLLPELERIESALGEHVELFPPGSQTYPQFDIETFVRGDIKTQAEVDVAYVQAGIYLVDEVRAARGLAPLPNGAGKVPQITPVGGAPNPTQPPPADPAPANGNGNQPAAAGATNT